MSAPLSIHFDYLPANVAIEQCQDDWIALSAKTPENFFLSWSWIQSWLTTINKSERVVVCRCDSLGDLKSMFFFVLKKEKCLGLTHYVAHVHRVGTQKLDQVWIENNDVLTVQDDILGHAITAILNHTRADEVSINVVKETLYKKAGDQLVDADVIVDFNSVEIGRYSLLEHDYPTSYSKSLKRSLSQSHKFAKQNHLSFKVEMLVNPNDVAEKLLEFSHWHVSKWANTETPSGFENPSFVQFHKDLILNKHNTETSRPILILLWRDDEVIGVNYGFQSGQWFGFYLSSICPSNSNQLRLGLLMHDLSMRLLKDKGFLVYDFLAGDSRYKEQFCSKAEFYGHLSIKKKLLRFYLKNMLVKARGALVSLLK